MNARVVLVELSVAVAPRRRAWRTRLADVRRFALSRGRPVDPDVIALILAAREECAYDESGDRWTRLGVYHFLWADAWNWCSMHRSSFPMDVPEVLWTYLHYLRERRLFEPGSDPFRELLKPLRCYCGLDADGRRDDEGPQAPLKCECKVPYEPKRRSDAR